MKEADRQKRNKDRLAELHPTFRARVRKVIASLESSGLRPRIQDAWRSPEDQKKAFESGHSKLLFGFHNVTAKNGKPEALAVDLLDDDAPLSPSKRYLLQLAAAAQRAGLVTGPLGRSRQSGQGDRSGHRGQGLGGSGEDRLGSYARAADRRDHRGGQGRQAAGLSTTREG
jgi:hypothetical protein